MEAKENGDVLLPWVAVTGLAPKVNGVEAVVLTSLLFPEVSFAPKMLPAAVLFEPVGADADADAAPVVC